MDRRDLIKFLLNKNLDRSLLSDENKRKLNILNGLMAEAITELKYDLDKESENVSFENVIDSLKLIFNDMITKIEESFSLAPTKVMASSEEEDLKTFYTNIAETLYELRILINLNKPEILELSLLKDMHSTSDFDQESFTVYSGISKKAKSYSFDDGFCEINLKDLDINLQVKGKLKNGLKSVYLRYKDYEIPIR